MYANQSALPVFPCAALHGPCVAHRQRTDRKRRMLVASASASPEIYQSEEGPSNVERKSLPQTRTAQPPWIDELFELPTHHFDHRALLDSAVETRARTQRRVARHPNKLGQALSKSACNHHLRKISIFPDTPQLGHFAPVRLRFLTRTTHPGGKRRKNINSLQSASMSTAIYLSYKPT